MSNKSTADRINDILVDQLGINRSDITPESTLDSLGADSLDHVEIVMAFEEEFNIEIDEDNEWKQDATVADLIKLIDSKIA